MSHAPPYPDGRKSGFTLIELLVVISIIAVLSVIGMVVFSGVQKGARDAKRRGDVDAIAKALELHYNTSSLGSGYPCCCYSDWLADVGSAIKDPLMGNGFYDSSGINYYKFPFCDAEGQVADVTGTGNCTTPLGCNTIASFLVCAHLEGSGGNASDWNGTAASGASATYFCRKNQQ